jgi:hypothetical protein
MSLYCAAHIIQHWVIWRAQWRKICFGFFFGGGGGGVNSTVEGTILDLTTHMARYRPLRGSSYIPLPIRLRSKRAIINVKNKDNKCLMWSVLAADISFCFWNLGMSINLTGKDIPLKFKVDTWSLYFLIRSAYVNLLMIKNQTIKMDNRRRTLNDNTSLGRFGQLSLQPCLISIR